MPLYICTAQPGAIPDEAKGAIAREVTRVHCEVTGAPPTFVHCFFFDHGSPQVAMLHGDLHQSKRDRVMRRFRDNDFRMMIATDVVGRGIDVSGISHIINFDIPELCDDYVHRVGRTGRMGKQGIAFSLVTPNQKSE